MRAARKPFLEATACFALALLLTLLLYARSPEPNVFLDSYHYLSAAANLNKGLGVSTDIVHFGSERRQHRVPAPLFTWPPAYPVLIAAVARTGVSIESAAHGISVLSFAFCAALICVTAGSLGMDSLARWVAAGLFLLNSQWLYFSNCIASEPLFTLLASAGIFCLVIFENRAHSGLDGGAASWGFLIAGQVLLALSSYVRYAGYFFIAGSGLYLAGAFLMRRTVQAFAAFASCLIAGGLVMPLLLRNIRLAGSWRGNSEVGTAGWDMILRRTVTVVKHLLYGSSREAQAGLWGIITIVSLSVILILVLGSLKAIDLRLILNGPQMGITLAAAALGGYTALMIYAGGQTGISKDPRMFLPVVPLLALCAGSTISWLRSGLAIRAARGGRLLVSAVIANMVAYAALNGEDVVSSRPYVPHRPVAQAFCEADYTGTALSSWVDSHISPDAVLLAACGQQTGYVLKRRTISFFNSGFSERDCEEKAVRETMNQYRADYLILYPGVQSSCGIQRECRFLSSLIENRTPDWLEVANSNGKVTIFRRKNKPARNAGDGTHSSPLGQSGTVRDGSKPRE